MRGITRSLSFLLALAMIWLTPATASAQFISINQAKDQASTTEQTQLNSALAAVTDKCSIARKQVQSVLADAAAKKVGASASSRRIETIIGNAKTDLNNNINAYAKKNPPASQIRAVYNASQDCIDTIRRQSSEVLDQVGFDKAANPNQLTGKYLDYQSQMKDISTKGLQEADDRLGDRGTKTTVKNDLNKISADTQQKIEIATTGYKASNPDILPSALDRIKKTIFDDFAKSMATRLKAADGRGDDKSLDLSTAEIAEVESASKEMAGVVDRATQTIQSAMQQVQSANIPTSSEIPGQNPFLEAKYRVDKQLTQIRDSSAERIDQVKSRFNARTDLSQNAKDVLNKEAERQKNRLLDSMKEYETYFLAGDPTKKKYNNAKNDALDKAQGCSDFLCTLGSVVAGVGSGVLKATTGVAIQPKTFTTIMGIDGPNPVGAAYSSKFTGPAYGNLGAGGYYGAGGQYYSPYQGNQQIGLNNRCISEADMGPKFAFIEKAEANYSAADGTEYNDDGTLAQVQVAPDSGAGGTPDQQFLRSDLVGSKNPNVEIDPESGLPLGHQLPTSGNTSKNDLETTKKSTGLDLSKVFQNISPWLNQTIQGAGTGYFGGCYGSTNQYGGLPGYGGVYSSPYGANPVGYQMGLGTNNLGIGSSLSNANVGAQLATALGLMGQMSTSRQEQVEYNAAAQALARGGGVVTFDQLAQVRQHLANTSFGQTAGANADISNPLANLIYQACGQAVGPAGQSNTALLQLCKKWLVPTTTPTFNPYGGPTSNTGIPSTPQSFTKTPLQTASSQLTGAIGLLASVSSGNTISDPCGDSTRQLVSNAIATRNTVQGQYLQNVTADPSWGALQASLGQLNTYIDQYNQRCAAKPPVTAAPGGPATVNPAGNLTLNSFDFCNTLYGNSTDELLACLQSSSQPQSSFLTPNTISSDPSQASLGRIVVKRSNLSVASSATYGVKITNSNNALFASDTFNPDQPNFTLSKSLPAGRYNIYYTLLSNSDFPSGTGGFTAEYQVTISPYGTCEFDIPAKPSGNCGDVRQL